MTTPKFYTTEEVAEMLKLNVRTVRAMINQKRLRALKIGNEYRVTDDHLRQFIEDYQT
ncbi:MAG: helix-turn-helix domain-containing protein [Methanomicrobiales archaeon]|nr:helix-turn-helix domain-containing protein [Methanomicrobiales archaeon]